MFQGEFIIDVISEGAAMAITECLIQFKDRRWNCSTFDSEDVFGRILDLSELHCHQFKLLPHYSMIIMSENLLIASAVSPSLATHC